jgi:hypothetical protein
LCGCAAQNTQFPDQPRLSEEPPNYNNSEIKAFSGRSCWF